MQKKENDFMPPSWYLPYMKWNVLGKISVLFAYGIGYFIANTVFKK
jgi:hypothetical protein